MRRPPRIQYGYGGATTILAVLLVMIAAGFLWLVKEHKDLKASYAELAEKSKQPELTISEQVAACYQVPEEEPTLVDLDNPDKLKENDFFAEARSGDKVLMYENMDLLYRPEERKIIKIDFRNSPTAITSPAAIAAEGEGEAMAVASPSRPEPSAPLKADIRNGSTVSGLAGKWSQALAADGKVSIGQVANAAKHSYAQTLIYNPTAYSVDWLAQKLAAEVVTALPAGETAPSGDILIILSAEAANLLTQ